MTQSPYGSWPGQPGQWQSPSPVRPAWQQAQGFGQAPSWQSSPVSYPPAAVPPYGHGLSATSQIGYPVGPLPPRRRGSNVLLVVAGIAVLLGVGIAVMTALTLSTQASGYVNEKYVPPEPDLNPPPLPTINTVAEAQTTITSNSLYAKTVPGPTLCPVTSIDLTAASSAELETYMTTLVGCLMTVWSGPISAAGYDMPRPPVVIYSTPMTSGCGKLETHNAFYCSADQKIYYATDFPSVLPPELRKARFVVEMVVGHEFGHAVQARTGILTSFAGLESTFPTWAEKNDMNRRGEMQADCLSGEFIRSVSKSARLTQQDLANVAATANAVGDDKLPRDTEGGGDHGLGANRRYWTQMGMASTSVAACNTFVAPADQVG